MIAGTLHWVANQLAGAGLHATLNLADLNPPAAYVVLDQLGLNRSLCSSAELKIAVYLTVPAGDESTAYAGLDEMLDGFTGVLDELDLPITGDIETVTLAPSVPGEPLPALRFPITVDTIEQPPPNDF